MTITSPERVPVLLSKEQHKKLKKIAFDSRQAMAEHIRNAVKLYLKSGMGHAVTHSRPPEDPKRLLVTFESEQYEELRELAFNTDVSMTEHVRRAVNEFLL